MPVTLSKLRYHLRLLFFIFPVLCAVGASAQEPPNAPQTQYWVTDQAGILSASVERTLTKNAESFEEQTSHQVVAVTVETLDGWAIETYGRWLGNHWGIGQAGQNNGVLLLVAPNDRLVRIEVGRGLESVLSNATAQSIIDNEILPAFRKGDMQGGIVEGHRAIIQALGGEYRERTSLEWLLHLILVPFFALNRLLGGSGGGRFSGGGGSFGGGGASGSW